MNCWKKIGALGWVVLLVLLTGCGATSTLEVPAAATIIVEVTDGADESIAAHGSLTETGVVSPALTSPPPTEVPAGYIPPESRTPIPTPPPTEVPAGYIPPASRTPVPTPPPTTTIIPTMAAPQASAAVAAGLLYTDEAGTWLINESGEAERLTEATGMVAVSPDGQQVVVERFDGHPGGADLWLMDRWEGSWRNLTNSTLHEHGPRWWPGNPAAILFGTSQEVLPEVGRVSSVALDGSSGPQVLIEDSGGPYSVSPDGQRIAYSNGRGAAIYNVADGITTTIDAVAYGLPEVNGFFGSSWSPDGQKLAWEVGLGQVGEQPWRLGLAIFDLQQGSATLYHEYEVHGGREHFSQLAWSPSGEWIAYGTDGELLEGETDNGGPYLSYLWLISADGSNKLMLPAATSPTWRPDGAMLAYRHATGDTLGYQLSDGTTHHLLPAGNWLQGWLEQ